MSSVARAGRRRLLFHDGGAGAATAADSASHTGLGSGRRFAPCAGSVSFAVADRLLACSWRAGVGALAGASAGWALLVALDARWGDAGVAWAAMDQPGSVAAWAAGATWLVAAFAALVVFGLRRARMDDIRCGYRWWLVAAAACTALSVNATTHLHRVAAAGLGEVTGLAPLPDNAFWWFAPGGLVLAALAVRLLVDLAEQRSALAIGVTASVVIAGGWVASAGLCPSALLEAVPPLRATAVAPLLALLGGTLVVATLLATARAMAAETRAAAPVTTSRVRSETPVRQGASASPAAAPLRLAVAEETAGDNSASRDEDDDRLESSDEETAEGDRRGKRSTGAEHRGGRREAKTSAAEPAWIDGAEGYRDDDEVDSPGPRKRSKAERKQLRRDKERRAA